MDPIHKAVPEEIALEGLEGLTLEGLWFRLSERLKLPLPFPRHFQTEIWKMTTAKKCFEYYEIPVNRPTIFPSDRKEYFLGDHDDAEAIERMESTYYIYKYFPIDDPSICGSCEHYRTRKKVQISTDTSLEEIEKYGNKFVIVGSQNIRSSVLIPKNLNREVDINNAVYCLLERIGRSRYFGEMTSGTCSINEFVKDPKLLHYHRNILIKCKLVTRQTFQRKVKNKVFCGSLLHLPRFYNIVKDSATVMVEKLFEFLSAKPNKLAECEEIRKLLKISQKSLKKLVQSKQFEYIFELDAKTLFRKVYPNATEEEYMFKSINAEKCVSSIRLLDPKLDIYTLWPQDDDVSTITDSGFLDCRRQRMNMGLAQQAYEMVHKRGAEGASQFEIGKYFGLSKLNSRGVVRKIQRDYAVSHFMKDEGRQRVSRYITKTHAVRNNDQMIAEMTKLLLKADDQSATAIAKQKAKAITAPPLLLTAKEEPKTINIIKEHVFVKPEPPAKEAIEINDSSVELNTTESSIMDTTENDDTLDSSDRVVEIIRDSSFIDNVEDVKVNMRFLNHLPGKKSQKPGIATAISLNKVSQKVVQRINCILDTIKVQKVIDHVNLLYKIKEIEQNDDCQEVICRKSLFSLLGKLAADNYIKVVEIELISKSKEVKMTYFGEPNVTSDMYLWQSILEEEKLKHFVPFHRRVVERTTELPLMLYDTNCIGKKLESTWSPSAMKYDNFPKFIKMKLFHEFLFYIIYNYPVTGNTKIPIQSAIETWKIEQKQDYTADIESNITCVYSTEIDWRMFVPPLNAHRFFDNGWGFLRDIIHRIPLILYVKFTKCAEDVPGLEEFMHHPIKCNYLLHFLPAKMREQLLRRRKYVFVIDELCKRLCYAGLLQYGPQKSKEKDQVFVYLNRNAALNDTRSSEHGYNEVSPNIDYPEIKYRFDTMDHVHEYWTSMFNIATNTKLNKRNTAIGKDIVIEQLSAKEILHKSLKVQSPLSAPLNDVGEIPGDHLGAAGLDKAFLVHLKQSWNRSMIKNLVPKTRVPESPLRRKNRTVKGTTEKTGRYPSIVSLNSKSKIIRRVAPRKESEQVRQKKAKKMQYDNVDREALKLMKTLRVSWSDVEDTTLLMCKVAVQFVFPLETQYCHYINTALFRDVLHFRTEKAMNKTSRACQRRMANMWKKNTNIREQVTLYLEELRSNKDFMQKYDKLIARLKQMYVSSELVQATKVHFVEMIHRIHQLFSKYQSGNPENLLRYNLPAGIQELHEKYAISNPNTINVRKQQKYLDPVTVNDVEISLLMSMIHSAVCCSQDKTSYTMQLFDIYKNFNDGNLSQALEGMRQGHIIAINKTKNMNNRKLEVATVDGKNILPYAYSPFHLSIKYQNQHYIYHTNCDVFVECQQAIRQLSDNKHGSDYDVHMGTIYMMVEMIVTEKVTFRIKMAPKLVSLDPSVKKIPVSYEKLQTRFHDLMKYVAIPKDDLQLKSGKKAISFNAQDETYVYQADPMELFCNIDQHYIHIFCILRGMTRRDSIKMGSFTIAANDNECCLQNCITADSSMSFMERCWRIATSCKELIKEILDCQKGEGGSNKSAVMNKSNFLSFIDEKIIEKRYKELEETNRKVYGEKKLTSMKPMTARSLLEAVMRLATEGDADDETSTWISDYKKVAAKDDDEEIFDMEDATTKDQSVTTQSKDDTMDQLSARQVDMFVVNISKVFVDVNHDDPEVLPSMTSFDGRTLQEKLLPFPEHFRIEVLERVVSNCKWMPDDLVARDVYKAFDDEEITDMEQRKELLRVLEFIEASAQMGAKYNQFNIQFPDKQQLQHNVKLLQKMRLLLRTGVNGTVFVHWNFASLWLIDTYNVLRAEKESLPKFNKRDIKKNMDCEPAIKKLKLLDDVEVSTSRAPTARLQVIQEKQQTKESEEILNNRERFKVRPYPWIRINGSLNRRVLDKWLGVLLLHLSLNCGALLRDLGKKFNGLMLFDLRQLLEILQELGCVELKCYIEPKVSLFSSYTTSHIEPATDFDESKSIYVEITDDAMHRLSFFIGKKKYKSEFV